MSCIIKFRSILIFLLLTLLLSCGAPDQAENLLIAISKERQKENKYSDWLYYQGIGFNFVDLSTYSLSEAMDVLARADALLLTGGNDIYPAWYGKEFDTARCGVFDRWRDTLEMMALSKAIELKMPVLGICRGLQLINVHQGGTLYIDLPSDKGTGDIHRRDSLGWSDHLVWLQPETILAEMTDEYQQMVASNHHQGIEHLAPNLKPLAHSIEDNLIEAVGLGISAEKQFLMAVQWHPEWMDYSDELSRQIATRFLSEAKQYSQRKNMGRLAR
jgi:putative glutamine amidotransferase